VRPSLDRPVRRSCLLPRHPAHMSLPQTSHTRYRGPETALGRPQRHPRLVGLALPYVQIQCIKRKEMKVERTQLLQQRALLVLDRYQNGW
jgi:hypothetical protein